MTTPNKGKRTAQPDTHSTIHAHSTDLYGDAPDPAAPSLGIILLTTDGLATVRGTLEDGTETTTGNILGCNFHKRAYPADLHKVCPNAPTVASVTFAADTAVTFLGGQQVTFKAGSSVLYASLDRAHLAGWKATRTKRTVGRGNLGKYALDTRTAADPVDPAKSAAAHKAVAARRANAAARDAAAAADTAQ